MNLSAGLAIALAIALAAGYGLYQRGNRLGAEADQWKATATEAAKANAELREAAIKAEKALTDRELELGKIAGALETARAKVRKVPADACLDTPLPKAIREILAH